jgi:hypothetical protein
MRALRMIADEIQRQAQVMSFLDGFWIMGFGLILAAPLVLFLRRPPAGAGAIGAH